MTPTLDTKRSYVDSVESSLFSGPFGSSARLEISSDPLTGSWCKLGKLTCARVNNGLNFLLWLFGNWDMTVKIFVHKQANKHLEKRGNVLLNFSLFVEQIHFKSFGCLEHDAPYL